MAAGVTLGFLKYVLGFDSISFKRGASQADAELAKLQKRFQQSAAKMASIGKTMTLGLTAPLVAFGTLSFKAASDAAELESAFNVTFGKMSGEMNKWAEETGNALGRSTTTMQEAANTFGIFFNTAVPPAKAAEMSKTFAVLAQDLGSFFNVDPGEAMEKLRAGLSGEAEPLRKFGVFLNEAAVKAKALELGLTGVGGKLTEQEKIQARYALILEATSKAQGDVARTSGSTANQMVAAKEAFKELQVVVGTKLLPVLTPLIAKIASAVQWFTSLPKPVQDVSLAIAAVSAVAGPFLVVIANVVSIVGRAGPLVSALATAWGALQTALVAARVAALATLPALLPFLVPLAAIAAAVGTVYLAWRNWDKIAAIVKAVASAVKTFLVDELNRLIAPIKAFVGKVADAFQWLGDRLVFHSIVPDMVDGIQGQFLRLGTVMVTPAQLAAQKVAGAFSGLAGEAGAATEQLAEDAKRTTAQVIEGFGQMAASTIGSVKDMVATFKSGDVLGGIQQFLDLVLNVLRALGQMGVLKLPGAPVDGTRAAGGPVVPGRTYLVGENGPEFITPHRSGFVHPNGSGPSTRVMIVPSPYFDAVVDRRASAVAAPMVGQGMVAAVGGAEMRAGKRQRRSFANAG